MTTSIDYTAFIATDSDWSEEKIDQFGYARLREKAMNAGLTVIGDASRVEDTPAVAVTGTGPDGTESVSYRPAGSPAAGGKAPDVRIIRWAIGATPVIATNPVELKATVLGEGALARAQVTPEITADGGLVELIHGLGDEVTVTAYNANGEPVGYAYGVDLDSNRQEILLPPGVARLEAIRDEEEPETPEGEG